MQVPVCRPAVLSNCVSVFCCPPYLSVCLSLVPVCLSSCYPSFFSVCRLAVLPIYMSVSRWFPSVCSPAYLSVFLGLSSVNLSNSLPWTIYRCEKKSFLNDISKLKIRVIVDSSSILCSFAGGERMQWGASASPQVSPVREATASATIRTERRPTNLVLCILGPAHIGFDFRIMVVLYVKNNTVPYFI